MKSKMLTEKKKKKALFVHLNSRQTDLDKCNLSNLRQTIITVYWSFLHFLYITVKF